MNTHKKVKGTLVGCEGNIFSVFARFKRLAKSQGWKKLQIDKVVGDAMKTADYDLAICHILEYMEE